MLGFIVLAIWKGANDTLLYVRGRLIIPAYVVRGYFSGLPEPSGYQRLRKYLVYDEEGRVVEEHKLMC